MSVSLVDGSWATRICSSLDGASILICSGIVRVMTLNAMADEIHIVVTLFNGPNAVRVNIDN